MKMAGMIGRTLRIAIPVRRMWRCHEMDVAPGPVTQRIELGSMQPGEK